MRVSYPLKDISTDAEAKNYLGNRNLFGKYPIGAHNAWHGGIHLEGASREIQCIAQGRIIAYRFAEGYKKTIINNSDHLYSNGFILIQHDYKSKEKQKMTFYSLYHHLMPKDEITTNKFSLPDFVSKKKHVVTRGLGILNLGLRGRKLKDNVINWKDKDTIVVVIPKGELVQAMLDENSKEIRKGNWLKVSYTDKNNKKYENIYLSTKYGTKYKVKQIGTTTTYEIITTEDPDNSILGAIVRTEAINSSEIVKVIENGFPIKIDDSYKNKGWIKLADNTGYILESSLDKKKVLAKNVKLNTITACDIPIKAGVTIGYTGSLGFKGYKGYKATHLEVFTTDDVFEFLSNEKKDGKEEQYFTNIIAGTTLKTSLFYKVDIKANTPIKVLKIEGDYAQIKVTSITATLVRDTDINDNVKPFNSNKLYTIKNLTTVNKAFNGLATKDATFNTKQVKAPRNWRTNLNRTVTFYPNGYGKVFWIEKTFISKITEKTKKKAGIFVSITPDYFLTEEQKYDTVEREAKTGEKTTLYVDVCKAYIEVPFRTDVEEVTVEKEKVVDLRKFKKAKDDKKDLWYKVVLDDTTSSQCVAVKGWVKEKDLDKFSAYDWQKFGFKDLDAGNEYIYSVKDLCKAEDSAAFVTEIWDKTIDTDGNKVLDILELIRAFSKPEIAQKLSRLVCKHKNEWSYTMDEIKPEVKELYDFGIQLEEVTAEKQKLETERDDSLAKMETKIENLMWWDEASKKTYTAPIKEEDKTKTSSTKRPSMLPEGTVVEEIPQKDVVPLDNKTTAVKPDAKPTKDSIPTTSTTAAPAPETKVEEKEVPPKRMFPSTNIVHHFHPIAWVEQMRRVFGDNGICVCEARVRAFLRLIKEFEGVPGEKGYTTLFNHKSFSDMSTHPEKPILWYKNKKTGKNVYSTAAGAYQIMKETWWDYNGDVVKDHKKVGRNENRNFVKKYGIKDFSAKSQDKFCIALLIHGYKAKNQLNYLLNGFVTRAIEECASHTWASFTPGRYPKQGPTKGLTNKKKIKDAIHNARVKQWEAYDKFLTEELAGQSDLHLEPGFLKKFGIKEPEPKELIENKKEGLDLNKAIERLNKRAGDMTTSVWKCAKYVRWALEAGGMKTWGAAKIDQRPNSAKDYGPFLLNKGFKEVPKGNYQKGDISVIQNLSAAKPHGHIAMWNGENWVSDFVQKTLYPGDGYRNAQPNYKIYRWE